ncbi:hypothetical protein HFP15_29110 [Amycolatopsis sp. K13G38]|uniref:LppX_LprAFG lipoprotein n=1 Tax=Amycolatopsis acididurans TaxID=2724524 RepID=A0ABX1JEW4_9PSEU|nr:hypothetical protein [Amycolatopsis acididurans]NKQ56935.1 hypothetical protein [Amycolatopsis acididurans]
MIRRRLARVVAACALLAACAACSPSPAPAQPTATAPVAAATTERLQGAQVADAVTAAYQSASTVHVRGTVPNPKQKGGSVSIDLQLSRDAAAGTLALGELVLPVVRAGRDYYFQFTAADVQIAKLAPSSPAGRALIGKWVSSKVQMSLFKNMPGDVVTLLDYQGFMGNIVNAIRRNPITDNGTETIDGVSMLAYHDNESATLDVTATSPHFLTRMTAPPTSQGALTFIDWNKAFTVTAPSPADIYNGPIGVA